MKRLSRSILVTFVVAALTCVGPAALAAWNKSGNGQGEAKATSMPSGNAPTGTVSNRTLTVTWTAVTMPGGIPVDGYKVFRYNAGGTAFPVTGSCTGTVAGLTCTETAMAPGAWRYTVAPVYKLWQGAEGPMSLSDTVLAPVLNLTGSTNITSFPGTLNGSVNNYIPGQTLTMRLDNPTTGQVLVATVTPNTIPANGTAAVQVTVPNTVADGPHTLYAAGNAGDQAGRAFTINAPALTPTILQLINGGGGTTGLIQQNDSIQITYSQPLLVSSVCPGAPDDNQPVSAPGYVQITNNNGTSGHDRLVIDTALCAGGLNMGSISLGSAGFVTGTTQFDATITYTPATRRVTVVLGARTSGAAPVRVNSAVTATYTPDPVMMATNGRLISGTVSSSNGIQF